LELPELQPNANHRSQPRSNVFLSAALLVGSAALPVLLRNLSTRGALLDGASLPPAGSQVRVLRGELSADGEIAWQAQDQAGLRFSSEIDVEQWVRRIGHGGQQRIDRAVAALRTTEPARPTARTGNSSLAKFSSELDRICERLANSRAMTVAVDDELVRLNVLARELQKLAGRKKS
jgi:hypothetical protein